MAEAAHICSHGMNEQGVRRCRRHCLWPLTTKWSSLSVSQLEMEEHTVKATSRGHSPMPGGLSQYLNGISMTLLRNSEYASTFIHEGPRFSTSACSTWSGQASVMKLDAACNDSLYLQWRNSRACL